MRARDQGSGVRYVAVQFSTSGPASALNRTTTFDSGVSGSATPVIACWVVPRGAGSRVIAHAARAGSARTARQRRVRMRMSSWVGARQERVIDSITMTFTAVDASKMGAACHNVINPYATCGAVWRDT